MSPSPPRGWWTRPGTSPAPRPASGFVPHSAPETPSGEGRAARGPDLELHHLRPLPGRVPLRHQPDGAHPRGPHRAHRGGRGGAGERPGDAGVGL
ncbi:MAG: hypothetical protein MZV63_06505 [Marinilabiliales bacterium]|nr:hypothetical protein [Marinilabiliales bacterium]